MSAIAAAFQSGDAGTIAAIETSRIGLFSSVAAGAIAEDRIGFQERNGGFAQWLPNGNRAASLSSGACCVLTEGESRGDFWKCVVMETLVPKDGLSAIAALGQQPAGRAMFDPLGGTACLAPRPIHRLSHFDSGDVPSLGRFEPRRARPPRP